MPRTLEPEPLEVYQQRQAQAILWSLGLRRADVQKWTQQHIIPDDGRHVDKKRPPMVYKAKSNLCGHSGGSPMRPVIAISDWGEIIRYMSILSAKEDGHFHSGITRAIKTKKPYHGYRWYWAMEYNNNLKELGNE